MSCLGVLSRPACHTHPRFLVRPYPTRATPPDAPGSDRHPKRTLENLAAADIVLSDEEIGAIEKAMKENPVKGGRYPAAHAAFNWG